jgi:tetratricopeptide (TPR) repeat protein
MGVSTAARAKLALGQADEAFDLMLDVLDELRLTVGFEEEFDFWHALADLFDDAGAHEDALAAALIQLRLADSETMVSQRMSANFSAARSYRRLGDHEAAARHLRELRESLTDDYAMAAGEEQRERSLLHLASGEIEEALHCAEDAVATHRRHHQRYLEGLSLQALSLARRAIGDDAGAAEAEALAVEAHRDCGVPMP